MIIFVVKTGKQNITNANFITLSRDLRKPIKTKRRLDISMPSVSFLSEGFFFPLTLHLSVLSYIQLERVCHFSLPSKIQIKIRIALLHRLRKMWKQVFVFLSLQVVEKGFKENKFLVQIDDV